MIMFALFTVHYTDDMAPVSVGVEIDRCDLDIAKGIARGAHAYASFIRFTGWVQTLPESHRPIVHSRLTVNSERSSFNPRQLARKAVQSAVKATEATLLTERFS